MMRRLAFLPCFAAAFLLVASAHADTLSRPDAARFLAQASFGARAADIDHLSAIGYPAWIAEQVARPPRTSYARATAADACMPGVACPDAVEDAFYDAAVHDEAQLRQRAAFALSQIFVVSDRDGAVRQWGNAMAAYADVLSRDALGSFRTLLEDVTRNAAMGNFLSYIYNEKDDAALGTIPDQNFARESMQLFTIGLVRLHPDGSPMLDGAGNPIPTYAQADVEGASRVMTGFAPPGATDRDFASHACFCRPTTGTDPGARIRAQFQPMVGYPAHHSTSQKRFLGVIIPASAKADPDHDLKIYLDTLFAHPNVGPFIGRRLIQRLVSDNPSPAYVARVAAVFADNGAGVRGDLAAVFRAILLDPEARGPKPGNPAYGKIREPVLRMANILRLFNATGATATAPLHLNPFEHDRRKGLWQRPFGAATVFNFYDPSYTPPGSALAAAGLVAPEAEIMTTVSIADQDAYLSDVFENGGDAPCCTEQQRNAFTMKLDVSAWLPLVAAPDTLVEQLNQTFLAGQMTPALRLALRRTIDATSSARTKAGGITRGVGQIKLAAALRLLIASPDYTVQK